ncbi:MAG: DMT family transporter [Anaerolineales bacterium]|nr:DMT family transporter [Anaerolineales bacterium]
MSSHFLGIIIALTAAASWGGGDFSGGYAARRISQYQVLFLTSLSSLSLLLILAFIWGEGLPSSRSMLYAVLAGSSGALGLAALYKALSIGNSVIVAPVSGIVGTIIPVIAGIFAQGLPGFAQLIGFMVALLGIWLVTRVGNNADSASTISLGLAIFSGICSGGFLTLIAQVESGQVFAPLVVAKTASVLLASALIWTSKQSIPKITASSVALISGLLDGGGNIFYLFATHFTRLDIAAVLSSLYPEGTVLLSTIILKEKISPKQWLGVAACIAAIWLITIN